MSMTEHHAQMRGHNEFSREWLRRHLFSGYHGNGTRSNSTLAELEAFHESRHQAEDIEHDHMALLDEGLPEEADPGPVPEHDPQF